MSRRAHARGPRRWTLALTMTVAMAGAWVMPIAIQIPGHQPGWSSFSTPGPIPGLATASAQSAPATHAPVPVVATLSQQGELILVGPSGQIYDPAGKPAGKSAEKPAGKSAEKPAGEPAGKPAGPGAWQRRAMGGVAADVRGAALAPDGRIFVAGSRTPMYAFEGGAWHIHPLPDRGSVVLATSEEPAAAIGRDIYVWENNAWKRRASAPGAITALWAAPGARVYAATRGGALSRLQGGSWTRIRHPLASDDAIALLVGTPGKSLHALATSGAVLEVGASRARLLGRDPSLARFQPHGAATDADGTLWLAGTLPATPAKPAPAAPGAPAKPSPAKPAAPATPATPAPAAPAVVLVRAQGDSLVLVEPIPGIAPGDRVRVLAAHAHGVLVATDSGVLRVRDRRGQWKSATISTDQAPRAGSFAGPARTR